MLLALPNKLTEALLLLYPIGPLDNERLVDHEAVDWLRACFPIVVERVILDRACIGMLSWCSFLTVTAVPPGDLLTLSSRRADVWEFNGVDVVVVSILRRFSESNRSLLSSAVAICFFGVC